MAGLSTENTVNQACRRRVGSAVEIPSRARCVDKLGVVGVERRVAEVAQRDVGVAAQRAVDDQCRLGVTHGDRQIGDDRVVLIHLCGHLAAECVLGQGVAVRASDKVADHGVQNFVGLILNKLIVGRIVDIVTR